MDSTGDRWDPPTTTELPAISGEEPGGPAVGIPPPYPPLTPEALDAEWDGETLNLTAPGAAVLLRDLSAELVVHPEYAQTEWDRRVVAELHTAQTCVDHLTAGGKPDSVLVYDLLLMLGRGRAAHEHMEATAHEDDGSFYALTRRLRQERVLEPTQVHTPGRRRKPATTPAAPRPARRSNGKRAQP